MLQQTQVQTVIPYFERWMKRFPDTASLARSSESDVLRMWEGLGYYSRARNLLKGARFLVQNHEGEIPQTVEELLRIPGVGPYSAGAILSIGHNRQAPIVDGNVTRVLARVCAIRGPVDRPPVLTKIWRLAESLVPSKNPGEFNEALMELGALVCSPKNPACGRCPVTRLCLARQKNLQTRIPIKSRKTLIQKKEAALAVIRNRGRVLICQHRDRSLWKGLWGFPQWERTEVETPAEKFLESKTGVSARSFRRRTELWRSYTRYREKITVYEAEIKTPDRLGALNGLNVLWVTQKEIADYPFSSAHRKIQASLVA